MAFNINFNSKLNELLNELKLIKLDQLHPANLLQKATDLYATVDKYSDPRVEKWPLMSSPLPTMIIVVCYLLVVYYGPGIMEKRKPFQLKPLLVIYNVAITGLNLWIALELLYCSRKKNYNFICQLVNTDPNDEYELRIAEAIWWYYVSKGIEFMDTLFFILRKKNNQLSFLHLYHHSTMFAFWFVGAKWVPGGSSLSGAMVNCFIHVIMYSYYALAAIDCLKPYLWWKKWLTTLQLLQFTTGVVLGLHAILTDCQFTRWMQYVFVGYAFSFLILFLQFYKNSYIENREPAEPKRAQIKSKKSKLVRDVTKNEIRSMRIQSSLARQQSFQTKQEKTKKKYKKK